jgi:1,4-alpha-glucan branching enzyme
MSPASQTHALDAAFAALIEGRHRDPFALLGPHIYDAGAIVVRAFQPAAR